MIDIHNLDSCTDSGISYGGHSGSKKGVLINGKKWLVKYPKSTKSMNVLSMSYTTTPLSEYLGSHIYESIGIDTHETILGYSSNKLVVACKDFLKNTEQIIDFNAIKNNYDEKIEKYLEEKSSSKDNIYDEVNDIKMIMENNQYFLKVPGFKERFWDMFIIDAFISNNDRNEGNWGVIIDKDNNNLRIAPVYDNGAAFYGKSSEEKMSEILNSNHKFNQVAYDSSICAFKYGDKMINPLKYIESMKDNDCNSSLVRIYPKINLNRIKKIFDEIPENYDGISVFSKIQKEMYYKILEYRYYNILKPIYEKLIESE